MRWLAEQMPAGYCFRATSNVFLVQKGRRPGAARHASVGKPRENARPSPREIRFRRYVAVGERIDEGRRLPRRDPETRAAVHRNAQECRADPACEGMQYKGLSMVTCQPDGHGFWINCPAVGCISRRSAKPSSALSVPGQPRRSLPSASVVRDTDRLRFEQGWSLRS